MEGIVNLRHLEHMNYWKYWKVLKPNTKVASSNATKESTLQNFKKANI